MVEESLSGAAEYSGKLGPGVRAAHIDNSDCLDSGLWWVDAKEARGLATLDAVPELAFSRDNQMLIERVGVGDDFDPFAAAGNHREYGGSRCPDPHVVLQLWHVLFGRGFFRKRPGQHELTLEHRITAIDPAIERRRHPA